MLLARNAAAYADAPAQARRDGLIAGAAVLYVLVMFAAAGLKYVLLVTVLLAPGTILYFWSRREQNLRVFTRAELILFLIVLAGAVAGLAGLLTGRITP